MLYAKLGAYLGAVLVCIGLGWYLGGLAPKKALAQLQASDWQGKYQASQVALSTVQKQLKEAQDIASNNAAQMQDLQNANTRISADRDADLALARRLLNRPPDPPPIGLAVSKASGGQTASSPGPAPGADRLEGLLADTAAESERCAAQLNSLISEIEPQL